MTAFSQIPEQIGPYRVLRPIARGGMAEVYEVEDPLTGAHLACKLLKEEGTARKRFDREYEAMTRLNHPNIVRVYNYGFHERQPWMTMELLSGTTVQAYAKRMGRPGSPERMREVIRVAHDIARALDHIHRRGLIHRDLKSDNVLVLTDGRVKLLDFGAVHAKDALEGITREGEFLGTFAYASPEQFKGIGIDHRSDLYSLGVLLYRLATGKRPFWTKDHHDLARMHIKEMPKPPREVVPELPQELEDLILHLMVKRRHKRPKSGGEVAETLARIAEESLFLPGTLDVIDTSGHLVGRETQVRELQVFLDEGSPGSAAIIDGMMGSGRHTIMEMVKKEAEKREWEVWDCWGRWGDGVMPLVNLIGNIGQQVGYSLPKVEAAREQIRDVLERGLYTTPKGRQVFYESCATVVRARVVAQGKRVLILVWNLHDMGQEASKLLRIIRDDARRLRQRVLVVADVDATEGSLEEKILPVLGEFDRVSLPPLTVDEVAVLVGALLHRRPPPTEMARRIHTASGGLPDFVNEVVANLVKQGILRVRGDDQNRIDWAQREDLEIPTSSAAIRSIERELTRVPAEGWRVLETLAMVGGATTVDVVAWALYRVPEAIEPMVAYLETRGILETSYDDEGDRWVRWRHDLIGETILRKLHPCRRHVLRRRLLELLKDAPTFAAQVRLLLEAGEVDEAVKRGLEWGNVHLARNQPVTALEVLDPVVERIEEAKGTNENDLAQLFLLHTTCTLMTRPTDPHVGQSLSEAATHVHGSELAARLALVRANQKRAIGHYAHFRRFLEQAWEKVDKEKSPSFASEIATHLGLSYRLAAQIDEAGKWYQEAWTLAEASADEVTMAHAQVGLATFALARGAIVEAERMANSSVEYFEQIRSARGLSQALPVWVDALRYQGRFSTALEVLHRHLKGLRRGEAPSYYVRLLLANAWVEADLCRLGRAQESVEELSATLRKGEHLHLQLTAELVAGQVLLTSGQYELAEEALSKVCQAAEQAGLMSIAEHARALWGETMAALDDPKAAKAKFHMALTAMKRAKDKYTYAACAASRVRAMSDEEDPESLFESVADWIDQENLQAIRLEFLIARARWRLVSGQDPSAIWRQAGMCLVKITQQLVDTDKAVLRVHPWSRAVVHGR